LRFQVETLQRLGMRDVPVTPGASTDPAAVLGELEQVALACTKCGLARTRTKVVFGAGSPEADILFIGEAPGRDEDRQGIPFVGRAGQLLTKIIENGMKMTRGDVYIANILKCRPPNNRPPTPVETALCRPYLFRQIEIIRPKVIVLLGATAVRGLLELKAPMSQLRGRFQEWHGIQVMPTFHPAYLLRNPAAKNQVWADIKHVLRFVGRSP